MVLSYGIYIGLLVFCVYFAYQADRRNNKNLVWPIILALTLIAGLRDVSVGLDTGSYFAKFDSIAEGSFHLAYGLETSFKCICYVILHLVPSKSFLMMALAFLTNWCIITRFWELRRISSFPCMLLSYYMAFYFLTMNATRQFCAIAIVFYFTRYLYRKQPLKYLLGIVLAMLFHKSAAVGVLLLALDFLRWKELPKIQRTVYIAALAMIPVAGILAWRLLSSYFWYLSEVTLNLGLMLPTKILFLAVSFYYIAGWRRSHSRGYFPEPYRKNLSAENRFTMATVPLCYLLALVLAMLGYFFQFGERISWYFYMFEGVYFGILLKGEQKKERIIFGGVILFLLGYTFLGSMVFNHQGTMPYLFGWQ